MTGMKISLFVMIRSCPVHVHLSSPRLLQGFNSFGFFAGFISTRFPNYTAVEFRQVLAKMMWSFRNQAQRRGSSDGNSMRS